VRPRGIVVAHGEPMVAEALAAALGALPGLVPLGSATSAAEAVELGARADAVALDESLPGAEEAAATLRRAGTRVVWLGEPRGEDDEVRVPTRTSVRALGSALVPGADVVPLRHPLSPREEEILRLVSEGMPAKQVARSLGISPKTVEHHKTRIFSKLGVPNQAAAVRVGLDMKGAARESS